MTDQQRTKISLLSKDISALHEELNKTDLFVATREDGHGSVILSANEEGFVYLASIMLSLAAEARKGQHYHFDKTTVLSECQRPVIIQFEPSQEQV